MCDGDFDAWIGSIDLESRLTMCEYVVVVVLDKSGIDDAIVVSFEHSD